MEEVDKDEIIRRLELENKFLKKEYLKMSDALRKVVHVFDQMFPEGKIPDKNFPANLDDDFVEGIVIIACNRARSEAE